MAKTLREEDLVLNIIVNGNKGQKEAAALGREMRDAKIQSELLTAEQKKLEKQGKQNTTRYREVTAEIAKNNSVVDANRKKLAELGQSMKLTEQTTGQLRRGLTQLNKLQSQAVPGSAQYKKYEMQIQAVKARLAELGVQARGTGTSLNGMGSGFSRYFGGMMAGVASITSMFFGIRRATDEFTRFDDKLADVQKTTNLAKEDVRELSDELEQLRTRTSQEDLLGLARIGGKLGISDQDEILGFVDAMNKIVVALNEDLGGNVEETVNQMGKLVDIFGVKEEFGIEQSIIKVGSAINELGMASTANEGYLVDFSKRMGGVAPLANVSIQEILGLGATLDQLGQSVEVSGTALSNLFLKLSSDAAKFAGYAGMEVNAFKDLLEKDFMAAFTRVLQGVKGNSAGINELAATLGDLGLDGQRVIGVVGSLANNHEILTEQIALSNAAFAEGTSVLTEYEVKNETAAAKLEMSRKEVTKFWRELGEKLWPAITEGNSLLVTFLQVLMAIIDFVSSNIRWIATLTAGFVAYQVAVHGVTIATRVATIAMAAFNKITKANPIGLLISLLAIAGTALMLYGRRLSDAEQAQKSLSKANLDAEKSTVAERKQIERNTDVLKDNKSTLDERMTAIGNLRKIMPEVLKDYTDEEILSGKATTAIQRHTKAILARAKARAYENKITELEQELLDIESESANSFGSDIWNNMGNQIRGAFTGRLGSQVYQQDLSDRKEAINKELELLESSLEKEVAFYENQNKKINQLAENPNGGGGGGGGNKELTKEQQRAKERLAEEMAEWRLLLEKEDAFGDKKLNDLAKKYRQLIKMSEGNGKAQAEISAIYEKLKWERQLEILQEGAEKYRTRQLAEMDELNAETQMRDQQIYLQKLEAIDAMDITEEERASRRAQLALEQDELERTRESERLTARWLLLENFQNLGDLEIEEAKRVADEKAKIEKQLTDNAISERLRLATKMQELSKARSDAEIAIKDATIDAYQAGFGIMSDLFKENKALSNIFLVLEKGAAAASVIVNLQKEIAAYYATNAMYGPAGVAIATKLAMAAKIRAGISLATIAGQTIGAIAGKGSSSKSGSDDSGSSRPMDGFTPRVTGRERGGSLVQRDQDGRMFNARFNPGKRGYVGGPTVIVGENGQEFVANAQAVANPAVKALLDVIDIAQRNGTISTLNLESLLFNSSRMRAPGRESGGRLGAPDPSGSSSGGSAIDLDQLNKNQADLTRAVSRLNAKLDEGINANVSLLGKNGFIEKQKELETINNNANL